MAGMVDIVVTPQGPAAAQPAKRDPMPYLWGAAVGAIIVSLLRR